MSSNIKKAKSRLLLNVFSNLLFVLVSSLIIVLLTPYLIKKLGIELYGLIPLVISFIAYFNLITMSISNSVSRYVSLAINKNDYNESNTYFNSALITLAAVCLLLLFPITFIAFSLDHYIQIPTSYEKNASLLFFYVLVGALLASITSPFMVSTVVNHRFDIDSLIKIIAKLIQVIIVLALFELLRPSIEYYGISYLGMSLASLLLFFIISRKLEPKLKIAFNKLNISAVKEMANMSFWGIVNQVGALFYITISILLVNILLGTKMAGEYAAIAQWLTLLGVIGGAISNVFAPIAYDYIANENLDSLARQIFRSIKYITLLMALPVGILCGFSQEILTLWLGSDYAHLSWLMCFLLGPWVISIGIRPMFAIFMGLDKVKIPACVTLGIGILNVLLIVYFIKVLGMGLYAIPLALAICLAGKNFIFTPIYAALITNQKLFKYIAAIIPGLLMTLVVMGMSFMIAHHYFIDSLMSLAASSSIIAIIYSISTYFLLLKEKDKKLLVSLLLKSRSAKGSNGNRI